jgi:hypothetical protein
MKEYCQAIIEQFDDNDICKKCNRPYGEHYGLECPKEGTVIIKRDLIKEALSARDKEWEEKIESFWNGNYGYYVIPVREWELLKSQMKEGK